MPSKRKNQGATYRSVPMKPLPIRPPKKQGRGNPGRKKTR